MMLVMKVAMVILDEPGRMLPAGCDSAVCRMAIATRRQTTNQNPDCASYQAYTNVS